jgi:hypothetical protein
MNKETSRFCKICDQELPISRFRDYFSKKEQKYIRRYRCLDCANKIRYPYTMKYASEHREQARTYQIRLRRRLRWEVLTAYGGDPPKCACCGETFEVFLTIDHMNDDGGKQRKNGSHGAGLKFYRWLRNNEYPDGFQVLCFNCNTGRSILKCSSRELKEVLEQRRSIT